MPVELVENKLETALPVHLVATDGLEARGTCAIGGRLGQGQRLFRRGGQDADRARRERRARRSVCSALGDGEGALAARCAGEDPAGRRLAFRVHRRPSRNSRPSRWRSAAMSLPATARSRARRCASRCRPASMRRAFARIADGVFLARDLVNTPTNDMGPDELEKAARDLAAVTRPKSR